MFTGIIETVGTVQAVEFGDTNGRLIVDAPAIANALVHGESVAVDGVCLTVDAVEGSQFSADLMRITRTTTTLGAVSVGQSVNLERALVVNGRLGGHVVQGHVDGRVAVVARDAQEEWVDVTVEVPADLLSYVVTKGSITLSGVSLTVARMEGSLATVSLIPTTLRDTTLGVVQVGDTLNIEVDIVAKYVESMLRNRS